MNAILFLLLFRLFCPKGHITVLQGTITFVVHVLFCTSHCASSNGIIMVTCTLDLFTACWGTVILNTISVSHIVGDRLLSRLSRDIKGFQHLTVNGAPLCMFLPLIHWYFLREFEMTKLISTSMPSMCMEWLLYY